MGNLLNNSKFRCLLKDEIESGDIENIKRYLNKKIDTMYAFEIIVEQDKDILFEKLLDEKDKNQNMYLRDSNDVRDVLQFAIKHNKPELFKIMLSKKTLINLLHPSDLDCVFAYAAENDKDELCKELLDNKDLMNMNSLDYPYVCSMLISTIKYNKEELCKTLLNKQTLIGFLNIVDVLDIIKYTEKNNKGAMLKVILDNKAFVNLLKNCSIYSMFKFIRIRDDNNILEYFKKLITYKTLMGLHGDKYTLQTMRCIVEENRLQLFKGFVDSEATVNLLQGSGIKRVLKLTLKNNRPQMTKTLMESEYYQNMYKIHKLAIFIFSGMLQGNIGLCSAVIHAAQYRFKNRWLKPADDNAIETAIPSCSHEQDKHNQEGNTILVKTTDNPSPIERDV